MTDVETLFKTAAACGIVDGYHDIWGKEHRLCESAATALLAAMGCDVDAVRDACEVTDPMAWSARPVQVFHERDETQRICVTMPAGVERARAHWRIVEEQGAQHQGDVEVLADVELSEERLSESAVFGYPHTQSGSESDRRPYGAWFDIPVTLPLGYHAVEVGNSDEFDPNTTAKISVIVAPARCYLPDCVTDGKRSWGVSLQVYALRSADNWGVGDFGDLGCAIEQLAGLGAGVVGINPLHVLFASTPEHASPYSPSSRLLLNPIYLDVPALVRTQGCERALAAMTREPFQRAVNEARADDVVDYEMVWRLKQEILQILYDHFVEHVSVANENAVREFASFREAHGTALRHQATFDALQEYCRHNDPSCWGWQSWAEAFQDPNSVAVAEFAKEHRQRIGFFEYLQWRAAEQLADVAHRANEAGLDIGLYRDLAVGVNSGGAEAWSHQDLFARGVRVGAPPDDFSPGGQDWGLPPMVPHRLLEQVYKPFIATLRANMAHAGALRIDHVMGLMRLFWIPADTLPTDGVYVRYPFQDLLSIVALESVRHRCLIIGEDLGTVPDEMRSALHDFGVLSYRLAYFEKYWEGDHSFKWPHDFATQAVVCASTHDLPTLAGFWTGADLKLRDEHALFPSEQFRDDQWHTRFADRDRIVQRLRDLDLVPADQGVPEEITPELSAAIQTYLATTNSALLMIQLEDVFGQRQQINLPGTTDERPNWRFKLEVAIEDWATHDALSTVAGQLREMRAGT